MSVDYSPVGGIGLKITNDIKKKLVIANKGEAHDGCMDNLLSDLELEYNEAGDGNYTGQENTYYLLIEGNTLSEINQNVESFIEKLNDMNINVKDEDLKVISELHVW